MDLTTKFQCDRATAVRIAGLLSVIGSMFLRVFAGNDPMRGYECAQITFTTFFAGLRELIPIPVPHLGAATLDVFIGASGLINPLLPLYLSFKPTRRTPILAISGILAAEAVSVLVVFRIPPGIGFFVWVAGIILILAPPYKRRNERAQPLKTADTPQPSARPY